MSIRAYVWLAILLLGVVTAAALYRCGGNEPREESKALRKEAQATRGSIEISKDTAERIDIAESETRAHMNAATTYIHERIEANPAGADSADPDIVREAGEAYGRAIRAACRVQRTSNCPAASTSSGVQHH